MEFDESKENIQPLRGGRNKSQLEIALQAQDDSDLQKELLENKKAFEETIRTYEGDDPLDNWYNFISWVEQTYPKHGHEGNLIPLLEDCLSKFENYDQYKHDRRLCKLWIKYIDLQQNPVELFQLLHAKEICVSCADLYRAWAFYYEMAGDYKRADAVFQLGLQVIAQPYEELAHAHNALFMAAGKHMFQEVNEERLDEQRRALTSLRSYKHKHKTVVGSVRTGSQVLRLAPGTLQVGSKKSEQNTRVSVFTDESGAVGPSIGANASCSIIEAARRQDVVHKENMLKPGPWSILKPKKNALLHSVQHHKPNFKVHEDELQTESSSVSICLYPNFVSTNRDNFSDWKTDLFCPEPDDSKKIPMYPRHLVYSNNTEYSLEEIIARKYLPKKNNIQLIDNAKKPNENIVITAPLQAHSKIKITDKNQQEDLNEIFNTKTYDMKPKMTGTIPKKLFTNSKREQTNAAAECATLQIFTDKKECTKPNDISTLPTDSIVDSLDKKFLTNKLVISDKNNFEIFSDTTEEKSKVTSSSEKYIDHENLLMRNTHMKNHDNVALENLQYLTADEFKIQKEITSCTKSIDSSRMQSDQTKSFNNVSVRDTIANNKEAMKDVNDLWQSTILDEDVITVPPKANLHFQIHEDSIILPHNTSCKQRTDKERDFQIFSDEISIHDTTFPYSTEAIPKKSNVKIPFTVFKDSEDLSSKINDNYKIPKDIQSSLQRNQIHQESMQGLVDSLYDDEDDKREIYKHAEIHNEYTKFQIYRDNSLTNESNKLEIKDKVDYTEVAKEDSDFICNNKKYPKESFTVYTDNSDEFTCKDNTNKDSADYNLTTKTSFSIYVDNGDSNKDSIKKTGAVSKQRNHHSEIKQNPLFCTRNEKNASQISLQDSRSGCSFTKKKILSTESIEAVISKSTLLFPKNDKKTQAKVTESLVTLDNLWNDDDSQINIPKL